MISFRNHIKMMEYIQKGGSPSNYLKQMKPMEALSYLRDTEKTYPVKENIKKPNSKKKIHTEIYGLVLGQFIMIEQIITGKTKLADHLIDLEIAKLIIRPYHHKEFDNDDPEEERKNEQDILNMDVLEVYWVLERFIENRNKTLFKDFSGVFYDVLDEDEEKEGEETEETTSEMMFSQQWYWYSIVRMLAQEDITRYGDIYMLPMSVVLPEMSYLAQRNKIESAKQRQSQAMRRL